MVVTTRTATVEDAAAIAVAHARAWQVAYDGIVPASYLDAIDIDARTEHWRQNLSEPFLPDGTPSPTNLVAVADGAVVGFACVGVWRGDRDNPSLGELWAIYVHPDHWGTGAGYALMSSTMQLFDERKTATAYLWVLEQNDLARRFYERQGWKADEVMRDEEIAGATIAERRYSLVCR